MRSGIVVATAFLAGLAQALLNNTYARPPNPYAPNPYAPNPRVYGLPTFVNVYKPTHSKGYAAPTSNPYVPLPSPYAPYAPHIPSNGIITQTVTAYKTYCPTPTTFWKYSQLHIVTTPTYVTVTCPYTCTITNVATASPTVIPIGQIIPAPTTSENPNKLARPYTSPTPVSPASSSNSGTPPGSPVLSNGASSLTASSLFGVAGLIAYFL